MPQRICANCFTTFCSVLNFRQECVNAQSRLLQAFITQNVDDESTLCLDVQNNDELQAIIGEQLFNMQNESIVLSTSALEENNLLQTSGISEDMHFIQNIANLIQSEQVVVDVTKQQLQVESNESMNIINNNNDLNSHDLNNQSHIIDNATETMKKIDSMTVCTTVPTNMDSMDLEDMLQSSIIPKRMNTEIHEPKKYKNNYRSSVKDFLESDDEHDDDDLSSRIISHPFACQYCHCPESGSIDHLIFADCDTLSKHFFDVHDPDRPYNCPFCTLIFQSMSKREQHVKDSHTNKKNIRDGQELNGMDIPICSPSNSSTENLQCVYCKEEVPGSMDLHELNCCYQSDWTCSICDEVFKQAPLYRFRTHQRSHDPNKPLYCRHCSRNFVRPGSLAQHEKTHFSNQQSLRNFKCEICSESFSNEVLLKAHKNSAHPESTYCTICNKAFASYAFYLRHRDQFHPKKLDANSCTNCGVTFSSALKLRNHLARARDENGQCIDFNYEPQLKRVRRSRSNNMLSCQFCAKRFSSEEQLEKHVAMHNPEERPLPCDQCQLRCRNETELQEHMNLAHLSQLSFNCTICQKTFDCNKDYQEHISTHAVHVNTQHGMYINGDTSDTSIYFTDESQEHSNVINGQNDKSVLGNSATTYFELPHMPTLAVEIQENRPIINDNGNKNEHELTITEFPGLLSTNHPGDDQYYFNIDPDHEIVIT